VTPERAARAVRHWVSWYTRGLAAPLAQRRIDEIDADLHDQIADERSRGTRSLRVALSILSRMARGIPADLSWRRSMQPSGGGLDMRAFAALLVVALLVAAVAFIADSGPIILGSATLVGLAALVALALGVSDARRGNYLVPFVALTGAGLAFAALASSAMFVGMRWDAPGLVLWGIVLITAVVVGAFAIGMRVAQRRG
jgi:hypothetical protein